MNLVLVPINLSYVLWIIRAINCRAHETTLIDSLGNDDSLHALDNLQRCFEDESITSFLLACCVTTTDFDAAHSRFEFQRHLEEKAS